MTDIKDYIELAKDIFAWLSNQSVIILSIIILILIATIILMYRFYRSQSNEYQRIHTQISSDIFNIKQGNLNTASLVLYPVKQNRTIANYNVCYKSQMIINPFNSFGNNFAVRISSKHKLLIEDINLVTINSAFIGGFYTIHLNEGYFQKSMNNYYSLMFFIHIDSDIAEVNVDLINDSVTGSYKFNLIK